jgi:tetratricopeptide (TPR) repeat protein
MENPAPSLTLPTTSPSDPKRYWFFVSYSHTDQREATRIQRAIESFTIPAILREASTRFPSLPKKPAPIFRDREALASSHDLTAEIRASLAASSNLLVVCSPAAANSKWVAREVECFLEIHGPEAVFCLVVDGEPNAADPAQECLPAPLRRSVFGRDILAADLRRHADGRRQALLKILAGGLGLPYERLAARERRRATRRAATWISASLLVALGFGALALQTEQNRRKAEREARRANLTSDYLTSVLLQFLPNKSNGIPNAALIPLIDASASEDRLSPLNEEPLALIGICNLLATAYLHLDQPEKALALYERSLALAESTHGQEHPVTLECRFNVACALGNMGNGARAEQLYLDLLASIRKKPDEFRIQQLTIVNNLGALLGESNRRQEAADLFEANREALQYSHPHSEQVLHYRANHANQLLFLGKTPEATNIFREVTEAFKVSWGHDHTETLMAKQRLAKALMFIGENAEAELLLREILNPLADRIGRQNPFTLGTAFKLVCLLHNVGRPEEGCAVSAEYFGSPPDPELVKKGSGPNEVLPPCP